MGSLVIVERQIIIPRRARKQFAVTGILIHIHAPEGVCISAELSDDEVFQETVKIKIFTIPVLLVSKAGGRHGCFHGVEEVLDEGLLLGSDVVLIRMLNGYRYSLAGTEPYWFAISVSINLDEISVLCLNPAGSCLYLVAKLITAAIFAIDHHIHRMTERSIALSHSSADLEGNHIPQQCLVSVIVDKGPLLCRSRGSERALF